ncbi:MAG: DNRLRE domain-containing protein [Deltaproteobacteria bacterium]|nr:DNRLRE domain-containing protein [Deltaproteobacteria bacterium]
MQSGRSMDLIGWHLAGALVVTGMLLLAPEGAQGQESYTVVRGQRVERSLAVPCALEFDLTNKKATNPGNPGLPTSPPGACDPSNPAALACVEEHLAWAVTEDGDWQGGNPAAGTYTAAYRDYKLKVYSATGYAGERNLGVGWDPAQTYTVRAEIKPDRAVYVVKHNGAVLSQISVSAPAPARVTMGYGWPPSVRNGALGAVLSNIKWEEATVTPPTPGEAEADTFTQATAPAANHGGEGTVQTGGDGRVIFLRFAVAGDAGAIASAVLNLEAVNGGGGGAIHLVPDNSWAEGSITHDNQPCISPTVLDSVGKVAIGGRYAFDVTAAVSGNGTYSFAIRSTDSDGSAYHSRESSGGMRPTLAVSRGARPALTPPAACGAIPPDSGPRADGGPRTDGGPPVDAGPGDDGQAPADPRTPGDPKTPDPSGAAFADPGPQDLEAVVNGGGCSAALPRGLWVLAPLVPAWWRRRSRVPF